MRSILLTENGPEISPRRTENQKFQHFLKIASIIRNDQNAPRTIRNDVIEPLGCIRTHRNNCRHFPISQNVQIKIGPNMVPEQWQTTSDHQSEARKRKLDPNKTDNSPGVTLSSWFWWSKLAMNTNSAHIVGTPPPSTYVAAWSRKQRRVLRTTHRPTSEPNQPTRSSPNRRPATEQSLVPPNLPSRNRDTRKPLRGCKDPT